MKLLGFPIYMNLINLQV